MMEKPKLHILCPCYNPTSEDIKHHEQEVVKIKQKLDQAYDISFYVVDDGSNEALPQNHLETILSKTNGGKGSAIKYGINSIKDIDSLIYTDYDFPYTTESLLAVATQLGRSKQAQLIISRRSKAYFNKQPIQRRIISSLIKGINKNILGLKNIDTQAGLKGIKGQEVADLLLSIGHNGFLFEIEFIQKAEKRGIAISSVDVVLREDVKIVNVSLATIGKNIISMASLIRAKIFPKGNDR